MKTMKARVQMVCACECHKGTACLEVLRSKEFDTLFLNYIDLAHLPEGVKEGDHVEIRFEKIQDEEGRI